MLHDQVGKRRRHDVDKTSYFRHYVADEFRRIYDVTDWLKMTNKFRRIYDVADWSKMTNSFRRICNVAD